MKIQEVFCSNFYTLLLNQKGELQMFGTLKGFSKFLFESPTKDRDSSLDPSSFKLDLSGERISQIALSEKSFAVYCEETK